MPSRLPGFSLCLLTLSTLLGCLAHSPTMESPAPTLPDRVAPATDQESGASLPLGVWEFSIDIGSGELSGAATPLEPAERSLDVIGDLFDLEVADYFTGDPCNDCFGLQGLGLDSDGNLRADFRMRHPFRTTVARKDLDVFDPRMILLTNQTLQTFPDLGTVLGGIDGSQALPVALEPGLVLNADGHTAHYDWIAEEPAVVGTPRNYSGTINPYWDFFTEDDPDPTAVGTPIASRRMAMASATDVKSVVIPPAALTARGGQLSALLVIEVSYGQPAVKSIPTGTRGSRLDPVYYLPAFNRKEAIRLATPAVADFTAGVTGDFRNLDVEISDWQTNKSGVGPGSFAQGPDYLGTSDIPYPSTLTEVKFSAPDLDPNLKSATSFPLGDGTLTLPWTTAFSVINNLNPPAGQYYGLMAAVDSYHGNYVLPGFAYGTIPSFIADFQTFKVVPITAAPSSGNNPPIAVLKGRKQGDVTWVTPPATLTVDLNDVVEFTLEDSTDDLSSWSNPAGFYDLDGSAGTGADGGFEVNGALITDIVTATYSASGLVTTRAKVRDDLPQFSSVVSLDVDVLTAPNDPPVAVLKARKQGNSTWIASPGPLTIGIGDTVEYTLEDSTDDLNMWANPAAHYDIDGNAGNGYEQTEALISDIATQTYSSAGTVNVQARVEDNLPQFSTPDTFTINVNATPTCYDITPLLDFPIGVYEHSADTIGDKIYIAGGWSPSFPGNKRVNYVTQYDPGTNSYTQMPGTFRGIQAGRDGKALRPSRWVTICGLWAGVGPTSQAVTTTTPLMCLTPSARLGTPLLISIMIAGDPLRWLTTIASGCRVDSVGLPPAAPPTA